MDHKILVTGGAGYVGSHFVRFLIDNGFAAEDIVVFDASEKGVFSQLPEGVKFYRGDLKNKADISRVFLENKIDSVAHFAAYISVEESVSDPGLYFRNNVFGTLNLLEAMYENNVKKIVLSSTASVFKTPEDFSPIAEDFEKGPENPYGRSKVMVEEILKSYERSHGISYVILRYFNVAGAAFGIGENHEPETHLIPLVMKSVIENKDLFVFGNDYDTLDGTCVRDYIHVFDLARAHLLSLRYLLDGGKSDCFNLGTGKGTSILEIIKEVGEVSGKEIDYQVKERRAGDAVVLVADHKKAKKILGWEPEKSLREMIESAYFWELKKKSRIDFLFLDWIFLFCKGCLRSFLKLF